MATKPTTALHLAIYDGLGSPKRAAPLLGLSYQAIYQNLERGYLVDRALAFRLAKLARAKGVPVTAAALMAVTPADEQRASRAHVES